MDAVICDDRPLYTSNSFIQPSVSLTLPSLLPYVEVHCYSHPLKIVLQKINIENYLLAVKYCSNLSKKNYAALFLKTTEFFFISHIMT